VPKLANNLDYDRFRSVLRDMRREAGLRQSELADRLGRPQSFVSKYESGQRRLDFVEVERVCKALGASLRELISRIESR